MEEEDMYDWYLIFDLNEFEAKDVPRIDFTCDLDTRGAKNFTLLKTLNGIALIVDDVALIPKMNGRNGFNLHERAAYIDHNNALWVGFKSESNLQ